jgi:hypothetical protein
MCHAHNEFEGRVKAILAHHSLDGGISPLHTFVWRVKDMTMRTSGYAVQTEALFRLATL